MHILLRHIIKTIFHKHVNIPSEESTMVSFAPLLSNTSQSLTVLSHEPLARRALLELKLSELTGPSCPASTCYQIQLNCKYKYMYNVNRKMFVNFFGFGYGPSHTVSITILKTGEI